MIAAASDDRGFVTQMMALRESLTQAQEAITTAMANYQHKDAQNAAEFPQA
ncbi:hypothetical protein V5P93_002530 [Actinokineospora auranticolor]|uniref:hypothetical protein n=1 Tax=Actinokineospora auranticolor TaxID=155976 RepID=UPI001FE92BE8|nr:hypothetical protein [Actinokineospora auranticolor]